MANAIAVDASGNAYVVGQTFSSDLAVPAHSGHVRRRLRCFCSKLSGTARSHG